MSKNPSDHELSTGTRRAKQWLSTGFDHLWMAACNSAIWLDEFGILLVRQVVPTVVDNGREASEIEKGPEVSSALSATNKQQGRTERPNVK